MNVLSLFDGMSCGQVALQRAGIEVDIYFASEIDKYAIAVTQHNFPETIQLGDITKWREWDIDWAVIDLIIGGSPCQGLSSSGKGEGLKDNRSRLFFEWVEIRDHILNYNSQVAFLLENVVPKKKEWAENMSLYVGVDPIMINSALVSAQSRKRLYWTNIAVLDQPKDRGVRLVDIIEPIERESTRGFYVNMSYFKGGNIKQHINGEKDRGMLKEPTGAAERVRYGADGGSFIKTEIRGDGKSNAIIAGNSRKFLLAQPVAGRIVGRRVNESGVREDQNQDIKPVQLFEPRLDRKSGAITTVQKDNVLCIPTTFSRHEHLSGKVLEKALPLESSNWRGLNRNQRQTAIAEMISTNEVFIRGLTPIECERLQTLPDNYTKFGNFNGVVKEISKTQRYKMLGNGFTVDVISHILKGLRSE